MLVKLFHRLFFRSLGTHIFSFAPALISFATLADVIDVNGGKFHAISTDHGHFIHGIRVEKSVEDDRDIDIFYRYNYYKSPTQWGILRPGSFALRTKSEEDREKWLDSLEAVFAADLDLCSYNYFDKDLPGNALAACKMHGYPQRLKWFSLNKLFSLHQEDKSIPNYIKSVLEVDAFINRQHKARTIYFASKEELKIPISLEGDWLQENGASEHHGAKSFFKTESLTKTVGNTIPRSIEVVEGKEYNLEFRTIPKVTGEKTARLIGVLECDSESDRDWAKEMIDNRRLHYTFFIFLENRNSLSFSVNDIYISGGRGSKRTVQSLRTIIDYYRERY